MIRVLLSFCMLFLVTVHSAVAQSRNDETVWLQIEAHPSLAIATQRAQLYGQSIQDVNGFSLGNGWYAVALGPFERDNAEIALRGLRRDRLIPRDSYIVPSDGFRSQFWPVGANLLNAAPAVQVQLQVAPEPTPVVEPVVEPQPVVEPDETPREARASEAKLTRDERKELQSWLKWAGFYNSAIDGAFGRGTRASMAAWQGANNFDQTGVMTTRQRALLREQYFAPIKEVGLKTISNNRAGIEMLLPMAFLKRSGPDYPFVHFDAKGDVPAKALLISQEGDQNTLFGLYDIMQTLEIVPLTGARERKKDSFMLIGQNDKIISYTEASLKNGRIKGFTLVWPQGDEERRTRVLDEMKASFKRIPGVLDPSAGSNAAQDIDLLSGLDIRRPTMSRSGFFVNKAGVVITTAEAVQGCSRLTIERDYAAELLGVNDTLGLAVLRPKEALVPQTVAALLQGDARLQSEVAVAGYSYEGVLGAPSLTFGRLADIKGLYGEPEIKRLALTALPGDAGGPIFDTDGSVMGMLLPKPQGGARQLPGDVSFAAGSDAIRQVLSEAGINAQSRTSGVAMAPEDITRMAAGLTVLVSCWN